MLKLLKYNFQERYKFLIGICIGLILVNLGLIIKLRPEILMKGGDYGIIAGLSALAGFAALVIEIVSGINLYRRDLHGETGYLLFTLPQKAVTIVSTKLLTTLIEIFVIAVVEVSFLLGMLLNFPELNPYQKNFTDLLRGLTGYKLEAVYGLLVIVVGLSILLLMVYFSVTLSKVAIGSRKYGKILSFGIFILLTWITARLGAFLISNVPLFITKTGNIMSITALIYNIVVCIVLLIGTSYLLEHRMEM